MAHHLINLENIEWIKDFHNSFLIRHPKDVISSYIKKNKLNHISELGYPQQYELIKYLRKFKKNILVIVCGGAGVMIDKMNDWKQKLHNNRLQGIIGSSG